jgi:hypothetical protein
MADESKKTGRFQLEHTQGVPVSDDELVADMKRVASEFGDGALSCRLYESHGRHSVFTVRRRFGTWNQGLAVAGLRVLNELNISDEQLFANIEAEWVRLGRQPRRRDLTAVSSKYSEGPYTRRFGSWRSALQAFIQWTESRGSQLDFESESHVGGRRRTSRDPNMALRFRVMRRDSFRCRYCGKSPATDPGVQLHVDHIVPWAKGGETTLDNLQTLCSGCNLGKGTQPQESDM